MSGKGERAALGLALLLAGCAHGLIEPLPAVQADHAVTLTVIREHGMLGVFQSMVITSNGDELAAVSAGEHVVLMLPAGERTLGVTCFSCPHDSIFVRLEAKGHYYLRVWATSGGPRIARLSRDRAEQMIKDTVELK